MWAWGESNDMSLLYLHEGSFSALLDPQIEIDPDFLVSYEGRSVPASDLYSLAFSPGMTNGAQVPEPVSMFLVGAGMIVLGSRLWARLPLREAADFEPGEPT
jgi:hypothetical protein